jgi:hypothetical protein
MVPQLKKAAKARQRVMTAKKCAIVGQVGRTEKRKKRLKRREKRKFSTLKRLLAYVN